MPATDIRAIIFDFGNVVGFFDYGVALQKIAPHTRMTVEEIGRAIDATDLEDAYESGRISSAEFLRHMRRVCGLGCPEELLRDAWSDIFWPNADVCELIPRLRPHYRLVLGSNTNELHALHFQKQFADVLRHFDALALSYEIGHRKPRPEFFQHCLRLAGCAPSQSVFIDDLPANIAGARACGRHGIVYTDVNDLHARLADLGLTTAGRSPA